MLSQSLTALGLLLSGVQKRFPSLNLTNIPVGGKMYTFAQIVGILQPLVDNAKATATAAATLEEARAVDDAGRAQAAPFIASLRQAIYTLIGNGQDELADFGMKSRKTRAPKTVAQKAVAAAKGAATRKARHTLGAKAKRSVKGTVPAVIAIATATAETVDLPATTDGSSMPPAPQGSASGAAAAPQYGASSAATSSPATPGATVNAQVTPRA